MFKCVFVDPCHWYYSIVISYLLHVFHGIIFYDKIKLKDRGNARAFN
jgi:hypothetical protein